MKYEKDLKKHLFAGFVAGAVSRTCTAPLDRIKVFLQVHGHQYRDLKHCRLELTKEGGFIAFWRGNGINVIKVAPESAFKFMAYEKVKRVIRGDSNEDLNFKERVVAGSCAGAFAQTVIYPLEVMKTRLVLRQSSENKGIVNCFLKTWRLEGFRGLYRGYLTNLVGIIPYAGIELGVYETVKRDYFTPEAHGSWSPIFCAISGSTCGQLLTYPIALVRTKLQATPSNDNSQSMMILLKQIWKNEGMRGFYRGLTPNFVKVAPATGISYYVYERTREKLGAQMS